MDNHLLNAEFAELSTPLISDSCLRLGLTLQLAPSGICPLNPDSHIAGRVLPVKHYGSVDIFLEAMGSADEGDILVIDNNGRMNEGCIGDLTALEAQSCKLAGLIVWGCHRDTADLRKINLPIFSYGSCPAGPQKLYSRDRNALVTANFGKILIKSDDVVFADTDGVLFAPGHRVEEILSVAKIIWQTERCQANAIRAGKNLRKQLRFDEYLKKHSKDPSYSFRNHLRMIGGSIEE